MSARAWASALVAAVLVWTVIGLGLIGLGGVVR